VIERRMTGYLKVFLYSMFFDNNEEKIQKMKKPEKPLNQYTSEEVLIHAPLC
jgi:hypothetical protein